MHVQDRRVLPCHDWPLPKSTPAVWYRQDHTALRNAYPCNTNPTFSLPQIKRDELRKSKERLENGIDKIAQASSQVGWGWRGGGRAAGAASGSGT